VTRTDHGANATSPSSHLSSCLLRASDSHPSFFADACSPLTRIAMPTALTRVHFICACPLAAALFVARSMVIALPCQQLPGQPTEDHGRRKGRRADCISALFPSVLASEQLRRLLLHPSSYAPVRSPFTALLPPPQSPPHTLSAGSDLSAPLPPFNPQCSRRQSTNALKLPPPQRTAAQTRRRPSARRQVNWQRQRLRRPPLMLSPCCHPMRTMH
jgi:hypothetical protein